MFNLLVTVNSIALVVQAMSLIKAFKKYISDHLAILSVAKYDIPSLIWPPPHYIVVIPVVGGMSYEKF